MGLPASAVSAAMSALFMLLLGIERRASLFVFAKTMTLSALSVFMFAFVPVTNPD
jgi:hypothetical protein